MKVSDPGIIQFFYPNFIMRDELSITDRDNDILYVGKIKPKIKQYLTINTKHFISTSGPVEVDFTKPEVLVTWVYEKKGHQPPKTVMEQIKTMDLSYIEYLCKVYYVSGHWIAKHDDVDDTIFNLFQQSVGSTRDLLRTYFNLREIYPYEVIQSSFITFLGRVISTEDQSVSPKYMMVLKQAYQRYGNKVRPLVTRLGMEGGRETDFINLLLELK